MAYSAEFPFLLLVLHVSGGDNDATSYAAVYKCFKRPNLLYYRGFQQSTSTSPTSSRQREKATGFWLKVEAVMTL